MRIEFYSDDETQIEELPKRVRAILGVPEELLEDDVILSKDFLIQADSYVNKQIQEYEGLNESLIEDVIEKLQKEIEINKTEFKKYNEKIKILEKEIGRLTEEIRKKQEQNNQIDIYNKLEIQKKELEEKKEEIKDKEEKVKKNQEILSKILPIEKRVKESRFKSR